MKGDGDHWRSSLEALEFSLQTPEVARPAGRSPPGHNSVAGSMLSNSSGLPARWECLTPSCCLNPPLSKVCHELCKAGGEHPPAHLAEMGSSVAALRKEEVARMEQMLVLCVRLWDGSTLQPSRANSGHRSHTAALVHQP